MAAQQTIHYELANETDLDQLVDDMSSIEASTIIVAFRKSPRWEASDLDLARLVAAARNWRKQLIAEKGNNAVADRAVLAGFRDQAVVSDGPDPALRDTNAFNMSSGVDEEPTAAISSLTSEPTSLITPDDRYDSTANLATYRPINRDVTISWNSAEAPNHNEEPDEPVDQVDIPRSRKPIRLEQQNRSRSSVFRTVNATPLAAVARTPANPVSSPAERYAVSAQDGTLVSTEDDASEQEPDSTPFWQRIGPVKLAAAVLAPVLVIVVMAAMAVYMLPTAEITLVPQEESVSSSLTYGVAATGTDFDISLDPSPLTNTSSAEITREATGERYEPAGTASGSIQITNPLTNEVTIPAGTEIPGSNGVMYYTAEDLRIAAADPYGSMAFGSGQVGVYAGVTGPDGNIEAGALTGQLGTQMFYTNPGEISGGWMQAFSVITEDDIEAARQQVEDELLEKAESDFLDSVPTGLNVIEDSLEVSEPEIEVSAEAGEDGESVSASGTITVRAQIFDPSELHQLAGAEADRLLARQGGSDRILLAETVAMKDPMNLNDEDSAFRIEVEAVARKVITEAEKTEIVEGLKGMDREEAEEYLSDHPKLQRHQITIEPDWLPDRLPEITSRISVHVSSGEPTASTR